MRRGSRISGTAPSPSSEIQLAGEGGTFRFPVRGG